MAHLASSIEGLFDSGKYADATISCEGTVFKVHCAIVCSQSKVLAKMVAWEAALRNFELPNDELSIVSAMIRYLYTGSYFDASGSCNDPVAAVPELVSDSLPEPVLPEADQENQDYDEWGKFKSQPVKPSGKVNEGFPLLFNVKIYVMADIYDIPNLKALAKTKFQTAVEHLWNTPTFSEAAKFLWENTMASDRMLRDVVVSVAQTNIKALLERTDFSDLMGARGDFCLDVLKLSLQDSKAKRKAERRTRED